MALGAESTAAYHASIAKLPVTITSAPANIDGVDGNLRSYVVRGVARVKHFTANGSTHRALVSGESFDVDSEGDDESAGAIPMLLQRVDVAEDEGDLVDCTATYEGTNYEGECATQQEIDDALSTIAALDAEVSADAAEAESECPVILNNPSECGEYETDNNFAAAHAGSTTLFSSNSVQEDGNESAFAEAIAAANGDVVCSVVNAENGMTSASLSGTAPAYCVQSAIDAAVGIAGWGFAKYAAIVVMTSSTVPPAGAVLAVVAGSAMAAWSAVSGVSSYLACIRQT